MLRKKKVGGECPLCNYKEDRFPTLLERTRTTPPSLPSFLPFFLPFFLSRGEFGDLRKRRNLSSKLSRSFETPCQVSYSKLNHTVCARISIENNYRRKIEGVSFSSLESDEIVNEGRRGSKYFSAVLRFSSFDRAGVFLLKFYPLEIDLFSLLSFSEIGQHSSPRHGVAPFIHLSTVSISTNHVP